MAAAFAESAFAKDVALSSAAFAFGIAAAGRPEAEGGISGYLRGRKMYEGANLMLQPMSEATRRGEEIILGWRDDDEVMAIIQIIQHFYD